MANIEKLQLHSKGSISLVTHNKSNEIFSCGCDDSIGIWSQDEDAGELVPDIQNCANTCQGVVAVYEDDIYVAETAPNIVTNNNQQVIVKYQRGDFESSAPLLTFSLEVTALAVSIDGQYLVAGASDFNVKCLQLNNLEKGYDRYECEAPIVSVSIDPKNVFFSVSTTDGMVHFRTIEKSAAKKPVGQFKACSKFSHIMHDSPRMQVIWKANGECAFIAGLGGVIVVDCGKWTQERTLKALNIEHELFSTAALSSTGEFLAACTVQGTLVVWRIKDMQSIYTRVIKLSSSVVTSIVFNPYEQGSIVAAYSEGFLGVIKDILKSNNTFKNTDSVESLRPASAETLIINSSNQSSNANKSTKMQRIDSDGDLSHLSEENKFVIFDGEEDEVDVGQIKSQYGFNRDGEFVGGGLAAKLNQPAAVGTSAPVGSAQLLSRDLAATPALSEPCATIKEMKIPKAFVSGSIPSQNNQRYLMWNMIGKIRSFKTSDESMIEVTFHDASVHPEFNIDNTAENYVIGDLNTSVVALASRCNEDKESKLYVRHIAAWDDSRDWFTRIFNSEEIECLSVGRDFIAIFTSFRFLRIFTAAGTQRCIISLPCPLVSMCADGFSLVTVRPTGGVIILSDEEYEHQLMADIFDVHPLSTSAQIRKCQSIPICLGEESCLEWIAFTSAGRLVTMDSGCTVRLYVDAWSAWTPILVGAELLRDVDSDHLWPIAVLERPEPKFRYVYCRGSSYPSAKKSLLPETTAWKIPVLEPDSNKSGFEHEMLVKELLQSMLRDSTKLSSKIVNSELARLTTEYTKDLIKLFAQNFNSGRECRAVELAHLTANAQGIQIMCNFAAKKERAYISEKIATIGRNRIQAEEKAKELAQKSSAKNATSNSQITAITEPPTENSTETNRIAPNAVRLKRKLNDTTSKASTNPFVAKRSAASTLNDDSDIFDDYPSVVPKTPISALLNSTEDSEISLNFNTSDVGAVDRAKNPFKRDDAGADDTWREGIDFFDHLSKKSSKSKVLDLDKGKGSAPKSKRQSKLSFGGMSTASKENDELSAQGDEASDPSTKRCTGFDLWSEKNRATVLDEFNGDPVDFQKYLVQKFRTLDSAEKARWNQAAKSQL